MESALERARRGAAFLDEKLGRGWRRKIRRRDLDLGDPFYVKKGDCGCVLAQLYPGEGYKAGQVDLGLSTKDARDLGFDFPDESYAALTDAWLTVLREG